MLDKNSILFLNQLLFFFILVPEFHVHYEKIRTNTGTITK